MKERTVAGPRGLEWTRRRKGWLALGRGGREQCRRRPRLRPRIRGAGKRGREDGFPLARSLQESSSLDREAHRLDALDDEEYILRCSEPKAAPLNVAVLVSGGVDSSVALRLLKLAGHNLKAFYLQIWFEEAYENYWGECPWEEDLVFVKKVCDQVGVELEVVPLTKEYWEHVVSYSISEIRAGCTPNPDMMCNSKIKFGAFVDYLEKNYPKGAWDRVASGHYARMLERQPATAGDPSPRVLSMSMDEKKDQTYFLASLRRDQLDKCVFPIGGFAKDEVRSLAQNFDLANKDRRDSQGICFLGKVNFDEFIEKHLGTMEGPLIEGKRRPAVEETIPRIRERWTRGRTAGPPPIK